MLAPTVHAPASTKCGTPLIALKLCVGAVTVKVVQPRRATLTLWEKIGDDANVAWPQVSRLVRTGAGRVDQGSACVGRSAAGLRRAACSCLLPVPAAVARPRPVSSWPGRNRMCPFKFTRSSSGHQPDQLRRISGGQCAANRRSSPIACCTAGRTAQQAGSTQPIAPLPAFTIASMLSRGNQIDDKDSTE